MEDSTKRLYGEEIGSDYRPGPSGVLGTVLSIADVFAQRKSPVYRNARAFGKYFTGEERIPTASEFVHSAYKQHVEKPAKKKVRDIFARGGKYAAERFDERVVRYAVQDYINGLSELPFIAKDRIEFIK